jgi:hypothetical protein
VKQDEIIEMAIQGHASTRDAIRWAMNQEREACAKEAEDSDHVVLGRGYHDQLGDADATARNIAVAIRARAEK